MTRNRNFDPIFAITIDYIGKLTSLLIEKEKSQITLNSFSDEARKFPI